MGVAFRITGMCIIIIEAIMHGLTTAPMAGMGSRSRSSRMCPEKIFQVARVAYERSG
jgi:hypothetical protein